MSYNTKLKKKIANFINNQFEYFFFFSSKTKIHLWIFKPKSQKTKISNTQRLKANHNLHKIHNVCLQHQNCKLSSLNKKQSPFS